MHEKMKAVCWSGTNEVAVCNVEKPAIVDDDDAIIRVTSASLCGSDMHLYQNTVRSMRAGDVLGHEAIGVIEALGPRAAASLSIGARVVVAPVVACGDCAFCRTENFSLCDRTNKNEAHRAALGGYATGGVLGFGERGGSYAGCQAQFVRVPHATLNCLPVGAELTDDKLLFLSDVFPTAWFANEIAGVNETSTVVVWGLGPIGLMTMVWARDRHAKRIIGIDGVGYRVAKAKSLGFESLNFNECDVKKTLCDIVPEGPDVCIDCVGFDSPKSWGHAFERTMRLESDAIDSVSEAIYCCRKGGTVALIGLYVGEANHFPIGPLMEKSLKIVGGTAPVQKFWKSLSEKAAKMDTSFLISHVMPLTKAPEAYEMFRKKEKDCFKVMLKPWPSSQE